jgi:thioredoxin-related protein
MMRRNLGLAFAAFCLAVLALGGAFHANAAREPAPAKGGVTQEIVVFEVENCGYCGLFRDQVLPAYRTSPRNAELPIRFVDLNEADVSKMKLIAPIQIVPTIVMIKNGQEVDRIAGYTGRETFFQLVTRMLQAE